VLTRGADKFVNREIKFRGKRLDTGEWEYGYYVKRLSHSTIYVDEGTPLAKVDPKTVGEYTGLHDRNGVEIWEGDIVRDDIIATNQVVFWESDFAVFKLGARGEQTQPDKLNNLWAEDCEVIGNIYENPELCERAS
jgi:uncharacterized phage protein (TIGR01671 family)